jgi:hypothetical protein
MPFPAAKLLIPLMAVVVALISALPVASADEVDPRFAAVGLTGASPLPDSQMDEARGAGFDTGLFAALFGLMPTGDGHALPGRAPSSGLGSFAELLSAFVDGLPPINLVAAEINDQPTVMLIGSAPQSLGCGSGISCPAGTTIYLSANNSLPPGGLSLDFTITH